MKPSVLLRLLDPARLGPRDARWIFDVLLAPSTSEAERGAILVALTARPESAEELAALAVELRRRAVPFPVARREGAVDLCGTGGAGVRSFNVSTVSALVVAAAGVPVVKHGNRSARGPCGSSDLLVALGLPVTTSVAFARESYRKYRIAFLHAPLFHPATRIVADARRALGIPTIFNRLGPLANPAEVPFQLTGTGTRAARVATAGALAALRVRRALVVTSAEGADEFSPRARTLGIEWTGRRMVPRTFEPRTLLAGEDRRGDWGPMAPPAAADETCRLLAGGGGARRGAVLLTSGAAIWVAGRTPTLSAGISAAREALDDGRAEQLLEELRRLGRRYPGEAS